VQVKFRLLQYCQDGQSLFVEQTKSLVEGDAIKSLKGTQALLLSPSSPIYPIEHLPQVWSLDKHGCRFIDAQSGAFVQLTRFRAELEIVNNCFISSTVRDEFEESPAVMESAAFSLFAIMF
jgi:hypothetical protein